MQPTKVYLANHNTLCEMIKYINDYLSPFLNIRVQETYCTVKVLHPDYFIILSEALTFTLHLPQTVITPWDKLPLSTSSVHLSAPLPTNQFVILIPKSFPHETHLIRGYYQSCMRDNVLRSLSKYMDVFYEKDTLTLLPLDPTKLYVFSKPLHLYLPLPQSGLYISPLRHHWMEMCHIDFKESWTLYIYDLRRINVYPTVPKTQLRR